MAHFPIDKFREFLKKPEAPIDDSSIEQIIEDVTQKCEKAEYKYMKLSIALGIGIKDNLDEEIYDCITKVEEKVYRQKLLEKKSIKSSIMDSLKKSLEESLKREIYIGYTTIGPQKDDFMFFLKDKEAKNYSSMGEKRSIVFSMKIAEIDMILKEKKENPLFMIDDITSYFDKNRQESVINYFKKRNIQTFITSTEELNLGETKFYIEKGKII
jgi:recombinational DNA repair ATPase RecF